MISPICNAEAMNESWNPSWTFVFSTVPGPSRPAGWLANRAGFRTSKCGENMSVAERDETLGVDVAASDDLEDFD